MHEISLHLRRKHEWHLETVPKHIKQNILQKDKLQDVFGLLLVYAYM